MKASIIMTAYNVGEYIEQAMKSVLAQSYKDIELIVVLDKPTDNTEEVLKGFEDDRIKVIEHNVNKGAGEARKTGIGAATGEYIICVDGDDWLSEDYVEALVKRAEETGADVIVGGLTIPKDNGGYERVCYGEMVKEGEDKYMQYRQERVPFINNKLIRKSLFDKVPYCTRRFIEDLPTYNKLLYFVGKVAYVNNDGYNYRQRESSLLHSSNSFKHALFNALFYQDVIEFYEKENKELLGKLGYAQGYMGMIQAIKQCKPTREMVEEFKEEWFEYSLRLTQAL